MTDLLRFCGNNSISAKFFEHVRVHSVGGSLAHGVLEPEPLLTFAAFDSAMARVFPSVRREISADMGQANYVYDCGGLSIRYCRYLCPFGLLWRV